MPVLPLISTLLLASCAAPQAQVQPGTKTFNFQTELDAIVSQNNGFGGGVFRVTAGPEWVVWEGGSGKAIRGNSQKIQANASLEIASTSKAVTAATVVLLAEQGLLDMDQPLGQVLPASVVTGLHVVNGHDYGPELTLRQCLNHTTGMGDYWNDPPYVVPGVNHFLFQYIAHPQQYWTPDDILAFIPRLDPWFAPGQGWHYSDSGYLLAGMVIEQVTGKPLEQVYDELIYQPLGMTQTWLHWRDQPRGVVQESHRYEDTDDMFPLRHNSADWAGGGLVSTTRDMHLFIRSIATGDLFTNSDSRAQMLEWVDTGSGGIEYGLGLFRVPMGSGMGRVWGHDGYGNSFMYYWPRHDMTFTGGLNQTEADWWPLMWAAAYQIHH